MYQKVTIIGRLGGDPEVRQLNSGDTVANFSVATDEKWRDANGQQQERTEWFKVVAFKRLGEICGQYLHKGSLVMIEGQIKTRQWQDQNGQNRYTPELVAREMKMLESRGASQGGNQPYQGPQGGQSGYNDGQAPQRPQGQQYGQQYGQHRGGAAPAHQQPPAPAQGDPGFGPDDDIPF